jgi:xanthine dehydrogenase/oxidase
MPACADDGEWEAIRDENVPAVPEAFASFGSMPAAAPAAQAGADSTSTAWASDLQLTVNAKLYTIQNPDPSLLLVDYLRDHLKLTGTKIGCGEGGCGACTVMLEWTDGESGQTVRKSINSCLRPLAACDGCTVTTVEGIGGLRHAHGYSPIQTKLASCNGSQCGYCSPGWVMSMYGLLANDAAPSPKQIEDHFDGNICRCTGYRPIMSAFKSLPFDSQLTAAPSATVAQRALHFSSPSCSFYKVLTMEQVRGNSCY